MRKGLTLKLKIVKSMCEECSETLGMKIENVHRMERTELKMTR